MTRSQVGFGAEVSGGQAPQDGGDDDDDNDNDNDDIGSGMPAFDGGGAT